MSTSGRQLSAPSQTVPFTPLLSDSPTKRLFRYDNSRDFVPVDYCGRAGPSPINQHPHNSLMQIYHALFTHSFTHSFIHSCVHSFVHSFNIHLELLHHQVSNMSCVRCAAPWSQFRSDHSLPNHFVGSSVPIDANNVFLVLSYYATTAQAWLKSDQRKALLLEKQKYLITPVEAFVSTYSILEMLTDSVGSNEKPPPAKYKTHWIVFISLYSTTMFMSLFWGDSLKGLPFPLRLLLPQLFNTTIIGFLVIPMLSALLQR